MSGGEVDFVEGPEGYISIVGFNTKRGRVVVRPPSTTFDIPYTDRGGNFEATSHFLLGNFRASTFDELGKKLIVRLSDLWHIYVDCDKNTLSLRGKVQRERLLMYFQRAEMEGVTGGEEKLEIVIKNFTLPDGSVVSVFKPIVLPVTYDGRVYRAPNPWTGGFNLGSSRRALELNLRREFQEAWVAYVQTDENRLTLSGIILRSRLLALFGDGESLPHARARLLSVLKSRFGGAVQREDEDATGDIQAREERSEEMSNISDLQKKALVTIAGNNGKLDSSQVANLIFEEMKAAGKVSGTECPRELTQNVYGALNLLYNEDLIARREGNWLITTPGLLALV
jgi:hypothetical protein